jgi:hypothetical protein
MARTTVWAVRNTDTGERLTYRYRSLRELRDAHPLRRFEHTGQPVEYYRTTQDLPPRKCQII